jgi:hypothetical protein
MVFEATAFSGYDPLLEWGKSYETAKQRLLGAPVDTLRAYGVRWHLLSPLLRHPVLSSNPGVNDEETAIHDEPAMRAVKPLLKIIVHDETMQLGELPDVAPLAFPQQRPALALPVSASGDGIRVGLKRLRSGGNVVVNFLWYPQMRATVDGKSVALSSDDFHRMVIAVPAGAKALHIRYAAGWSIGLLIGLGLLVIGLLGSRFGGRSAVGLPNVNIQTPD